jgi:hypothetical protein
MGFTSFHEKLRVADKNGYCDAADGYCGSARFIIVDQCCACNFAVAAFRAFVLRTSLAA